jgi:periplasmic divalent cation tolerance protein
MQPVLLYITATDKLQAVNIARALVEARLAACANVLPGVASVYRWEGEIEQAEECVIIAKSTAARVPAVTAKVQELHTYDCPCVVAVPIAGGAAEFLAWVEKETGSA